GVAGPARADVLVRRVRDRAPRVTGVDALHARDLGKHRLGAPEATSRQRGDLVRSPALLPGRFGSGHVLTLLRLAGISTCYPARSASSRGGVSGGESSHFRTRNWTSVRAHAFASRQGFP